LDAIRLHTTMSQRFTIACGHKSRHRESLHDGDFKFAEAIQNSRLPRV